MNNIYNVLFEKLQEIDILMDSMILFDTISGIDKSRE